MSYAWCPLARHSETRGVFLADRSRLLILLPQHSATRLPFDPLLFRCHPAYLVAQRNNVGLSRIM